eukprot:TRINITY_DN10033_c0_g1_i3.p2 TRINITY_DN10033_c0_g1~~TRINITY_DN10033_c0_g1_i3.p2  ORF type:complete len:199 (+),score=101.60 TRINITY_DN10033_c0_g1_i3:183-779(+)
MSAIKLKCKDPLVLQKNVKETVSATKKQIAELLGEVKNTRKDNTELQYQISSFKEEKSETEKLIEDVNEEIRRAREENEEFTRERGSIQGEVAEKSLELNTLLDTTEKEEGKAKARLRTLLEEEKKLKEEKHRQSAMNAQKRVMHKKRLESMAGILKRKEEETRLLREQLKELGKKDQERVKALEEEKKKLIEFISNT